MNNTIQLAKLFIALENLQKEISQEIVPLALHLGGDEEAKQELIQTLELAAQSARDYLKQYKLVAERQ